jgi:hypothetical protein
MNKQITIKQFDLESAAVNRLIDPGQIGALWQHLEAAASSARVGSDTETAHFSFDHLLYYFGGLIAIGALSLFTTLGFSTMGFPFLLIVAVGYCVLFLALTEMLLNRKLTIPAGIMGCLAIVMVPMAVFAMQNLMGLFASNSYGANKYSDYHNYIDWRWIIMELATLAAAALVLFRYRLTFIMMPVAVTCWYMSMDVAAMLMENGSGYGVRRTVAVVVGLLMIVASLVIDRRNHRYPDFGFWLCLFGAFSFWAGVSWSDSDIWWHKHVYGALSVGMVFSGALLQRRVFTILGALSFAGYLGYLSYQVFENSLLFPIVLSAIGLGIVAFGIWWTKREDAIINMLGGFLPQWLSYR